MTDINPPSDSEIKVIDQKKDYKECKARYIKIRMASDPEFRQKVYDTANQWNKQKRMTDPEYRAKINEYQRNYQ